MEDYRRVGTGGGKSWSDRHSLKVVGKITPVRWQDLWPIPLQVCGTAMCVVLSWSDWAQTIVKGVEALSEMYLSKEEKKSIFIPHRNFRPRSPLSWLYSQDAWPTSTVLDNGTVLSALCCANLLPTWPQLSPLFHRPSSKLHTQLCQQLPVCSV